MSAQEPELSSVKSLTDLRSGLPPRLLLMSLELRFRRSLEVLVSGGEKHSTMSILMSDIWGCIYGRRDHRDIVSNIIVFN